MTSVDDYRSGLRTWLIEHVEPLRDRPLEPDVNRRLRAALFDAQLSAVTWPARYGGQGWSAEYQTVYNAETANYAWALGHSWVTSGICAPTILEFGSDEQRDRHLPKMLRGDEEWSQLLSEPGAGSDLGSCSTKAEPDGGGWVVNGQKVWTSTARTSDFAIALVRTDPDVPKYSGLSMMLIDLKSPGVDIRPLRQMTGESQFNEVFLDDVRVPQSGVLGQVNDGWTVLSRMLFHERMALSAGTVGGRMDRDSFAELADIARERGVDAEPDVRHALADSYIQQRLLDYMGIRIRTAAAAGAEMGPVGSLGKIGIAKSARHSAETGVLIAGSAGQAWMEEDNKHRMLAHHLLYFPMTGIAGGTTEIQKNIVAERVLGLPREARPDRDLPFRKTKVDGAST